MIETAPSSFSVANGLATVVAASGGFVSVDGGSPPAGALDGEGLMTMLPATDVGDVVTTGSSPFADFSAHGEKLNTRSGIKPDELVFPARDDTVAGGTFDVPTSVGGASVEDDPSSDSVDLDVAVRYSAVSSADAAPTAPSSADAASTASPVGSQFQTPRSGKSPSTTPAVPVQLAPHASPPKLVKVQPLGSSIMLTPVA